MKTCVSKEPFLISLTSSFRITSNCWKSRASYFTTASPFCHPVYSLVAPEQAFWCHGHISIPLFHWAFFVLSMLKTCWSLFVVCWTDVVLGWFWVLTCLLCYGSYRVLTGVGSPVLFLPPSSCNFVSTHIHLPFIGWKLSFICMSSSSIHSYFQYDLQSKPHKPCWRWAICVMMISQMRLSVF